jgi:hypothetical protein
MDLQWIYEVKENIPVFLSLLKSPHKRGYYRYSLSGDYLDDSTHWGLGQAVFSTKILYMLNQLNEGIRSELSSFITSFHDQKGYIHDPVIGRLSSGRRVYNLIRHGDIANFFNEQTRRAETRQAFAALRCLNHAPLLPYLHIPSTKERITHFITHLDWNYPWGAASHVSHLLFFLKSNQELFGLYGSETEELIDHALRITHSYRQRDGAWYAPNTKVSLRQKINGAMKMMTAYETAGRDHFETPERLIDLCLSAINDHHACDHFNIVCVLYHCNQKTSHRRQEIEAFFLDRLHRYQEHYWPQYGGFSFFKGKANDFYYDAKISSGLSEPDIHGTVLFLWGIVLITDFLRVRDILGFKIPIT